MLPLRNSARTSHAPEPDGGSLLQPLVGGIAIPWRDSLAFGSSSWFVHSHRPLRAWGIDKDSHSATKMNAMVN